MNSRECNWKTTTETVLLEFYACKDDIPITDFRQSFSRNKRINLTVHYYEIEKISDPFARFVLVLHAGFLIIKQINLTLHYAEV
jgi:hypothetical protein